MSVGEFDKRTNKEKSSIYTFKCVYNVLGEQETKYTSEFVGLHKKMHEY